MVDIFDEVNEDLRAERAQRLLKQYGGWLIAATLVVIGAAAGWQGWQWWRAKQDMAAGTAFVAAMNTAQVAGPMADVASLQASILAFDRVAATAPEGYRTLARLRAAALMADAGNLNGAAALYDQVAADASADPLLRDLANLLWAQRMLDSGDPALLRARLKALAEATSPWHALASEQLALLDLRQGQTEAAKTTLRQLAGDPTLPQDLRGRASGLLTRLGG